MSGYLVVIEGLDGAGKTTQAGRLGHFLALCGLSYIKLREPGGTEAGEKIRPILLEAHKEGSPLEPLAELMLYNAARAQLLKEQIRPALAAGNVVILDRFTDSTVAYQVYGRGLNRAFVESVLAGITGGLAADYTILLDIDPRTSSTRNSKAVPDRFDKETLDFKARVRQGYREIMRAKTAPWVVIDGSQDEGTVFSTIWQGFYFWAQERGIITPAPAPVESWQNIAPEAVLESGGKARAAESGVDSETVEVGNVGE